MITFLWIRVKENCLAVRAVTEGIIIQAERTQKGVVEHGESLLKQAQAKLLGYILTNIQYHIPAYIYRYL